MTRGSISGPPAEEPARTSLPDIIFDMETPVRDMRHLAAALVLMAEAQGRPALDPEDENGAFVHVSYLMLDAASKVLDHWEAAHVAKVALQMGEAA